jgi:hypothetical protein
MRRFYRASGEDYIHQRGTERRSLPCHTLLRSILATRSEADTRAADALVKQVRIYPLSKASAPPEPRFVDMMFEASYAVTGDPSPVTSLRRCRSCWAQIHWALRNESVRLTNGPAD